MFNSHRPQRINNRPTETVRTPQADSPSQASTFSMEEMTNLLQISPERLRQWGQVYPRFLDEAAKSNEPRYSRADLATLIVIQKLLEAGHDHEQVVQRLQHNQQTVAPQPEKAQNSHRPTAPAAVDMEHASPGGNAPAQAASATNSEIPQTTPSADNLSVGDASIAPVKSPVLPRQRSGEPLNDLLQTVAESQQSMLNVQDSIREMLGVIVQDNFNLKHENRKLRDRMLELERMLAEYQRREETRKERLEGRLRAVESTLGAIQQQVAQLVQLYRQRKSRGWFR